MNSTKLLNLAMNAINGRDIHPKSTYKIGFFENRIVCVPLFYATPEMTTLKRYPNSTLANGLTTQQWWSLEQALGSYFRKDPKCQKHFKP